MPSSTTWSRCCCRAAAGSCAGTSGPCVPLLTATSSRKRALACSTRSTPTSVPQGQARQPAQPLPRQMRRDGGVWPQVRDGLEQSRDTHVELGRVDNEDDSSGSALPHHLVALASARPFPYPSVTAVSSNSCYYTVVALMAVVSLLPAKRLPSISSSSSVLELHRRQLDFLPAIASTTGRIH